MQNKTSDKEYYENYYAMHGEDSYLGEKVKDSSRMLVFREWLSTYIKPGDRVLDIGCGDAIFAELMPEYEWFAIDINTERAEKRINADRLVKGDIMKTPYDFEAGSFDAIICSEVLEHVWDLRVIHKEAKRLLKREGTYIISTPNFDWIQNLLEHHRRLMPQDGQSWTWEHIRHYNFDNHKDHLSSVGFVVEAHVGADAHYCPIFANACRAIRDGLREKGIEVPEPVLHQMVGKGVPFFQHTVCIAAKKA